MAEATITRSAASSKAVAKAAPSAMRGKDCAEAGTSASTAGYVEAKEEALWDHLQRAENTAWLLFHNFSGDGAFNEPGKAPGITGMCDLVSAELQRAVALARQLTLQRADIEHIAALALHMTALSVEELYGGECGFRIGDNAVGMAYWSISEIARTAYEELSGCAA